MKAYPFISGRGKHVGYGFTAAAPGIPFNAPWMSGHRASDTIGQRPILEMHCAGYGKPVFICSRYVVDARPFGYTEYLAVPLPEDERQRQAYLAEPGRMLVAGPGELREREAVEVVGDAGEVRRG